MAHLKFESHLFSSEVVNFHNAKLIHQLTKLAHTAHCSGQEQHIVATLAKLEDPNSFYLIDSIIKNVQQIKIPDELVIKICCRAASQLSNGRCVMPQILATWQKFVPEPLLVQIEKETGIQRLITEKVK